MTIIEEKQARTGTDRNGQRRKLVRGAHRQTTDTGKTCIVLPPGASWTFHIDDDEREKKEARLRKQVLLPSKKAAKIRSTFDWEE